MVVALLSFHRIFEVTAADERDSGTLALTRFCDSFPKTPQAAFGSSVKCQMCIQVIQVLTRIWKRMASILFHINGLAEATNRLGCSKFGETYTAFLTRNFASRLASVSRNFALTNFRLFEISWKRNIVWIMRNFADISHEVWKSLREISTKFRGEQRTKSCEFRSHYF